MESLEFTARPERHVVATYLGSVPEYFRTMRPIHPRLADAVANAESVFDCRVWIEPGAVLCDNAAACDAVRQFIDEYLGFVNPTFINDVREVEDLADGEFAFPQPGQRWVVYPLGLSKFPLDDVSLLVRDGDVIFAIGETDAEQFPVTGTGAYVLQLR